MGPRIQGREFLALSLQAAAAAHVISIEQLQASPRRAGASRFSAEQRKNLRAAIDEIIPAVGSSEPAPWGAEHRREMRRRFAHSVALVVMAENLPEEVNRVELDAEARDSHGVPAPRVTYRASENTLKMLSHGAASARAVLEAAGAATIFDNSVIGNFAHYMGTARMGTDPRRSVVNAWNQAQDMPNLFVVDGSSFTTCAAVNPTSTIGALALRAADAIWQRRAQWT